MTTSPDAEPTAVLDRIAAEFAGISRQMSTVSAEFEELRTVLASRGARRPQSDGPAPHPAPPVATPYPQMATQAYPGRAYPGGPTPIQSYAPQPYPAQHYPAHQNQTQPYPPQGYAPRAHIGRPHPQAPPPTLPPTPPRPSLSESISSASDRGTVGKLLAAAGVAVTLIGVALLLVLAAQAGVLRPEFRVAGGAILAGGLIGAAAWLRRRADGRTGAVALAATGVAAAYLDVLAATRIYGWLPIVAGLTVAAVVAGGGLAIARLWDSEALGLLVVVPLIVLAPVLTDGLDLVLIAFMIVLAAAGLGVQIGRDWIWLHAVRMAAPVVPLTLIAVFTSITSSDTGSAWQYSLAVSLTLVLALGSAVILLPNSTHGVAHAVIVVCSTIPVLASGAVVDRVTAAGIAGASAALVLAVVGLCRDRRGFSPVVRQVLAALAAVLLLIATAVAFDADVAVPVILGLSAIGATAARSAFTQSRSTGPRSTRSRSTLAPVWLGSSIMFWLFGLQGLLTDAPIRVLSDADATAAAASPTILISGLLLAAAAVVIARAVTQMIGTAPELAWVGRLASSVAAVTVIYAVALVSVVVGVLIGGDRGFLAGHVATTICWMALATTALLYARRMHGPSRNAAVTGGLALVAAAMAKLFLFDLATLDGIFRVVVFIVVGLSLLALGSWYAKILGRDETSRGAAHSHL
ncbi:DUF2339 domain-containing protein [Gordonia sp. ABSL11-1]|uniref:DUF2339 domain-containing protein n=1 Tax=Gordonia sp. ABSL11-1 TaxID=3053924 RepID=UPI002574052D|nr:DUF2339 domain-containing protein [Gordonia sp. ABSL11-1]MDL9948450.1 DUF2339 domain-containing protein [Gordonia sp. ABSL11-1]